MKHTCRLFYDGQHELCLNSVYTMYVICSKAMNKISNVSPQCKANFIWDSFFLFYFNILFDLYVLASLLDEEI